MKNKEYSSFLAAFRLLKKKFTMAAVPKEERPNSVVPVAKPVPSAIVQNLMAKEQYIANFDRFYCDDSSKYEKVAKIGQGTFGLAILIVFIFTEI